MPRSITLTRTVGDEPRPLFNPIKTTVATEAELLEFANRLRAAGDADPLGALMPSKPGHADACLIANALNFSSTIDVAEDGLGFFKDGSHRWAMSFPENVEDDRIREIARAARLRIKVDEEEGCLTILLPKHIGNAAHAFDSGDAFQDFLDNPAAEA